MPNSARDSGSGLLVGAPLDDDVIRRGRTDRQRTDTDAIGDDRRSARRVRRGRAERREFGERSLRRNDRDAGARVDHSVDGHAIDIDVDMDLDIVAIVRVDDEAHRDVDQFR